MRLAIPNGNLERYALRLLEEVGLKVARNKRCYTLQTNASLVPEVMITRPQVIPRLVEKGICDVGITGWDCVLEGFAPKLSPESFDFLSNKEAMIDFTNEEFVKVVCELDHHKWERYAEDRLRVVMIGSAEDEVKYEWEIKFATTVYSEYPQYTEYFFARREERVIVIPSIGSTESHIPKEFPYGVCVVATGKTLKINNLKIIYPILMETRTVFIANRFSAKHKTKSKLITALGELLEEADRKVRL